MAKKATKKPKVLAKKKPEQKISKKLLLIAIPLLLILGIFSYNKYLDRQNASDLKRIPVKLEQLAKIVEKETSVETQVEARCGSVGKFATSYSCSFYLRPNNGQGSEKLVSSIIHNVDSFLTQQGCIIASEGYQIESPTEDYFICPGIHVRKSNVKLAESIFR